MADNISRFILLSTHRTKDGDTISNQMRKNIQYVKTQFGRTIKEVTMDHGSLFINYSFQKFIEANGIREVYTTVDEHAGNSRAEKNIGTISYDTKTLLLQGDLSQNFRPYAARTAVNIRNCTYNKRIKNTPINVISNDTVRIILKSFLPFGEPNMVYDHMVKKTKAGGERGTILCKDPNGFGYLVYVPKLKKVILTTKFDYLDLDPNKQLDNDRKIGKFMNISITMIGEYNDDRCNPEELELTFPEEFGIEGNELIYTTVDDLVGNSRAVI